MPGLNQLINTNYFLALIIFSLLWVCIRLSYSPEVLPDYNSSSPTNEAASLPDFGSINNASEKKELFFSYLVPLIKSESQHLIQLRETVQALNNKITQNGAESLSKVEAAWLRGLSSEYNLDPELSLKAISNELLLNIDSIPTSLVLAQAAIESGWGTSRFAQQGNNLFGHWCFKAGCGIVPKNRSSNKKHEVAKFKSVSKSIQAYFKNLNSFSAYGHFRKLRSILRSNKEGLSSIKLLPGLSKYSEQGQTYLSKIKAVILSNNLTQYDLPR